MSGYRDLLYVDFDGKPTDDPDAVVDAGLLDARHQSRVPGLVAVLENHDAPAEDLLHACVALTTWGEPAGYRAVVQSALNPEQAPWRDTAIDRRYSVDNTFGQFAVAVRASAEMAMSKRSTATRVEALRALVSIADREYFDGQLEWAIATGPATTVVAEVEEVVHSGVRRLEAGERPEFDLATQLVDLSLAIAVDDEPVAVALATAVVRVAPAPRTLMHAAEIVEQCDGPDSAAFGEYLCTIGGDDVRRRVAAAYSVRNRRQA